MTVDGRVFRPMSKSHLNEHCGRLAKTHHHVVLRSRVDGEMSRFMGWIGGTHTMRYPVHHHTSGMRHLYQQCYESFPIQDDQHFLVGMSSATRSGQDWSNGRRIGSGDRCCTGCKGRNWPRSYSRPGQFRVLRVVSSGLMSRCRNRRLTQSAALPSEVHRWVMKAVANRLLDA